MALAMAGLGILFTYLIMRGIDGPKTGVDTKEILSATSRSRVVEIPFSYFFTSSLLPELISCF